MLVKYLLNWFTILFLSVQQFPSDVINLSLILVVVFFGFYNFINCTLCYSAIIFKYSKLIFEIRLFG